MGRLSQEKGLDLLVDALGDRDVKLTILGLDGPLKARITALASKDPRITIRSPVPHSEVASILEAHDIVCCLSMWNDPLPGAVIEGRLYGKAVLATNRGGIPEILQGYAKGVMVDPGSGRDFRAMEVCREGLARAVEAIRTQPDAAQEEAFFRRFSPATFTGKFEALYQTGSIGQP
jgi:glycosyltransferase involved in cell wall biosynthesis